MQEIVEQLKFFSELGVTHLNIESQKASSLEKIREEIGDCRRCKLWNERTHIVYGIGRSKADLMFVGEAPGREEDIQGIPFVGRAGKLLTGIIEAIDLKREDVYIANILKCRPPKNRNPEADEVESCEGFLFKQIEVIKPKIIVALGAYAAQCLLQTKDPIGRIRGRFFHFQDSLLLPTFHPAYLLRNPSAKRDVWEDIKIVRDQLKELGSSYYS
jgi:DNA polymerase